MKKILFSLAIISFLILPRNSRANMIIINDQSEPDAPGNLNVENNTLLQIRGIVAPDILAKELLPATASNNLNISTPSASGMLKFSALPQNNNKNDLISATGIEYYMNDPNVAIASANKAIDDLETAVSSQGSNLDDQGTLIMQIQSQIDELEMKTSQDLRAAQIDNNKNDIDLLRLVLGLDRVHNNGDVSILGKIDAEAITARAIAVETGIDKSKTMGQAIIKAVKVDANNDGIDDETGADGKSAEVKTDSVGINSRIFLTPEGTPLKLAAIKINVKNGFTIETDTPVVIDTTVNWWIVDEN